MTGGRRNFDEDDRRRPPPPVLPAPTLDEQITANALGIIKRSMKFRRTANVALRPVGISFAEWRVLEAAWRIIRRTDEPTSHLDVSRELDLDEGCVSRLMHALSWRSFVSHDLDAFCLNYRVLLTESGHEAVLKAYAIVARVAARELGA